MSKNKSFLHYFGEAVDRYRAEQSVSTAGETKQSKLHGRLGRFLHWLTPNGGTLLLVVALIATAQVWARPLASPAAAPGPGATTVNYQGRLANSDGTPLTEDGVAMGFAIYDAEEGGNLIWPPSGSEDHVVDVSDGLFSVGLGSKTSGGIPTTTWNGDRYLEITVGGETLEPRELIRSVPIAGMALTVPDGAITQVQAPFAPSVYHQVYGGDLESVSDPIIWSGWFHGSSAGYTTYNLSHIFSQVDAVMVMRTRTSGGTNQQVTFMVTDAAGNGKPIPSEIRIGAYGLDGELANWIQAYVVVIGR